MARPFRLRPIFAPVVKLIARGAVKIHMTPNMVTWAMFVASLVSAAGLALFQSFVWFGIWVFITGLLDGVDGAVARLTRQSSPFGGFFDSVMDRVSEGVIFGGLLIYILELDSPYQFALAILAVGGFLFSFLTSYSRARTEAEVQNMDGAAPPEKFQMNVGLLARSERLFYLFLMSLVLAFTPDLAFLILLSLFVVLTAATFLTRLFAYKAYLEALSVPASEDRSTTEGGTRV